MATAFDDNSTEANLEEYFRKKLKKMGWITVKMDMGMGFPDRLVIPIGKPMFFVELKTKTGRLSPLQVSKIANLRTAGVKVYVIKGKGELLDFLEKIENEAI